MNLIIENIEIKSLPFKNINDINKYRFLSKTSQSKFISEQLKNFIKIVDKTTVYYYNKNSKLWVEVDRNQYDAFVFDFYNNSASVIKSILRKTEDIDEQVEKKIKDLCAQFDKKSY